MIRSLSKPCYLHSVWLLCTSFMPPCAPTNSTPPGTSHVHMSRALLMWLVSSLSWVVNMPQRMRQHKCGLQRPCSSAGLHSTQSPKTTTSTFSKYSQYIVAWLLHNNHKAFPISTYTPLTSTNAGTITLNCSVPPDRFCTNHFQTCLVLLSLIWWFSCHTQLLRTTASYAKVP